MNPTPFSFLEGGEIGQIEAGYGFGAWCLDVEDRKSTAYVAFLPAAIFMPGLLESIVASGPRSASLRSTATSFPGLPGPGVLSFAWACGPPIDMKILSSLRVYAYGAWTAKVCLHSG